MQETILDVVHLKIIYRKRAVHSDGHGRGLHEMNPCLFQSPAGAASTFKPAPADPTARHCVSRTISLFRRAAGSSAVVLQTRMGHTPPRGALPRLPLEQVYITTSEGKKQESILDVIHPIIPYKKTTLGTSAFSGLVAYRPPIRPLRDCPRTVDSMNQWNRLPSE